MINSKLHTRLSNGHRRTPDSARPPDYRSWSREAECLHQPPQTPGLAAGPSADHKPNGTVSSGIDHNRALLKHSVPFSKMHPERAPDITAQPLGDTESWPDLTAHLERPSFSVLRTSGGVTPEEGLQPVPESLWCPRKTQTCARMTR